MAKLLSVLLALSSVSCATSDDSSPRSTPADTRSIDDTATFDSSPADAGFDATVADGAGVDAPTDDSTTLGDTIAALDARDGAPDITAPTGLRVDEIYVDRDLSGDAVEFVELAGPVGASLDGLHLRLVDATGKVKYDVTIDSGKTIGASGRWVVGGNKTDTYFTGRVDQSVGIATWGLDNTAGAVQLVSGTTLLDVVGYGAKVAAPSTPPSATYETDVVALPTAAKQSLTRNGGLDTGNNKADFCPQSGSPGSAGGVCP